MGLMFLINTLSLDPVAALKTGLRILHFIGLALGLGAATVLDLMIVRFFIKGKVAPEHWAVFHFGSKIVNWGLILLWVTGIGFMTYYGYFEPIKLGNEKVWAKMTIVAILTVNGAFIHAVILPKVKMQIGRSLMEGMSTKQRSTFLISGAVSATSWYVPLMLGALPQLNFVVPMTVILMAYGLLLAAAIVISHSLLFVLPADKVPAKQTKTRIEPMMGLPSVA
ncbi:hypothetical protein [Ensifer sp. LC163]|uniref:hypothetical protein n=1 Tax=Ensifer sp. LC163 TaxID=1120652 RepID=UPI000813AAFB|nr:hypothetical protein [Ensifer sp. LC163]OCP38094.1 hypothetical protein BC360_19280 [Ensifer sp. LC163]